MKAFVSTLVIFLIIPTIISAECTKDGYTVVFVNGIQTTEDEAKNGKRDLELKFQRYSNLGSVSFIIGYNESHLAGGGDLLQSIAQTFHSSVSDYDLNTILLQIHPQVETRKILLVGHSQGTFYTNELYNYFVKHGVPPESIAVYNIATPADRVAGSGKYLTSANDAVIYYVRQKGAAFGAAQPLPANILIPVPASEANDPWAGHHFSSDYLDGAAGRIVREMDETLTKLKADKLSEEGCFVPPERSIAYRAQAVAFKIADPTAVAVAPAAKLAANAARRVVQPYLAVAGGAITLAKALSRTGSNPEQFRNAGQAGSATAAVLTVPESVPPIESPVQEQADEVLIQTQGVPSTPQQNETAEVPTLPQGIPSPPIVESAIPQIQSLQPSLFAVPGLGEGGSGGGGGAEPVNTQEPESSQPESESSTIVVEEATTTIQQITLGLGITSPADNSIFATTTVMFTGTASGTLVSATIGSNVATTSPDDSGNWSFFFSLPEGTNQISFSASDSTENFSPTITRAINIDTIAPAAPIVASPANDAATTSTQIAFEGTAESGSTIHLQTTGFSATTSASAGAWRLDTELPTDNYVLSLTATDEAGNISATTTHYLSVVSSLASDSVAECSGDPASASGYFFSDVMDAEYADSSLVHHFRNKPQYSDGRSFRVSWNYRDDECNPSSTTGGSLWTALPAGITDWSVRFTSSTHFDVWNDASSTVIASADIPSFPSYTRVILGASVFGGGSSLSTGTHKILESGVPPSFSSTAVKTSSCPDGVAREYYFDQFEKAEYVSGLLRVHLRLKTPYNDGRTFLSAATVGDAACVAAYDLGAAASTNLPAYMRYYSFRMVSPTHWVLWNDENDEPISCDGCAGDISADAPYVAFYGSIDEGESTIRTTPYRPHL